MTEENKIKCSTSTTRDGKYGVVRAWLTINNIEYEEKGHSFGCHSWTEMRYNLTGEEFTDLLLYLESAGVITERDCHVII